MKSFKHYLEAVQSTVTYKNAEDEVTKERLTEEQFTEAQKVVEKIKSAGGDVEDLLGEYQNDSEGFWSSFRKLWFDGWKPAQSEMDRQDSEFSKKNNVYYVGVTGASSASGDEKRYGSTALQKHKVTSSEYDVLYKLVDNPNTEDEKLVSAAKEIRGKILLNVLDAKRRNNLLDALGVQLKNKPPSWLNTKKDLEVSAFRLAVPVKVN